MKWSQVEIWSVMSIHCPSFDIGLGRFAIIGVQVRQIVVVFRLLGQLLFIDWEHHPQDIDQGSLNHSSNIPPSSLFSPLSGGSHLSLSRQILLHGATIIEFFRMDHCDVFPSVPVRCSRAHSRTKRLSHWLDRSIPNLLNQHVDWRREYSQPRTQCKHNETILPNATSR